MSKLVYLDLLQMVTPGEQLDSSLFDFYVFGSFDALKVEQEYDASDEPGKSKAISSLHELHTISKKRRLNVPVRFDKQSMHLYALEDNAGDIFRRDGEYASQPLVLTLIQLDDYCINQRTPSVLVEEFSHELQNLQDSEELKAVASQVFFCLGEPDLVVVFRHTRLIEIARLIYRIRLLNPSEVGDARNGICVLSTSSHCAFPNASNHEDLKTNVNIWSQCDPDIRFLTFFDTSYGLDDNSKKEESISEEKYLFDRMLLGDWDYLREWNKENATDILPDLILEPVRCFDEGATGSFKSSWSVPIINLTDSDSQYAFSDRILSTIRPTVIHRDYDKSKTAFSDLSEIINRLSEIYGSDAVTHGLSEKVMSMHTTLVGILKHLCQLKDGRFQYDLYSFVRPAFDALPEITENTCALINRILNEYDKQKESVKAEQRIVRDETISYYLNSFIHDMARLLAELQHLFSVLSISPHTYMESYGSNMRSITATCKLLVAYQGIAYSLSRKFDMTMVREGEGNVKANEVMLVIPYRRIHQNTRVLFEYSSPENRVVYIRINASDMFHVQKTLFMLLHECGHHILSRDFRTMRVRHFFNAYSGYLLDKCFGSMYRDPFTSIQMPWIDSAVPDDHVRSHVKIQIRFTEEEQLKKSIIMSLLKQKGLAEILWKYWDEDYKKMPRQQIFAEPIALENSFIHYVKEAACYCISEKLKTIRNADRDDIYAKVDLGQLIKSIVSEIIIRLFTKVLDNEYDKRLLESDNELWHLAEIRTMYHVFPEEVVLRTAKTMCMDIISSCYQDVAGELKMIFSDIYSDIFAILTLGIGELSLNEKKKEAEKYLILLRDEASFLLKKEFGNDYLMVRIFAVLEGGLELEPADISDLLKKVLSKSESEIDGMRTEITDRIGYHYVLDYTKNLCVPSIRDRIEQSEDLRADTEKLKNMYKSAEKEQELSTMMDAVYYFWKASTQREG